VRGDSRNPWLELLASKMTLAAATVVLTLASSVSGEDRPWPWIAISATVIVGHAWITARRDRDVTRRLGKDYDRVQRRVLQIVADLGALAGDQYALWMVDLYVVEARFKLQRSWPLVGQRVRLVRALSVSLLDARQQPPVITLERPAHGECFTQSTPVIWFDPSQLPDTVAENPWPRYDSQVNEELSAAYGVLALQPVVDQLDRNCIGVLAVHVQPSAAATVKALGALRSADGQRRVRDAAVDLNGYLSG
jgi:hypothetical protein